jgi:hypothetical protein
VLDYSSQATRSKRNPKLHKKSKQGRKLQSHPQISQQNQINAQKYSSSNLDAEPVNIDANVIEIAHK